jgi:DNA-binding transcriptional LysR family regulator
VALTHATTGERVVLAIRPRMSTDSLYALRSAALAGVGVGIASAWLLEDALARGQLVHVAAPWRADPLPVYLVYPQARFYAARLRHFVDAMRAAVPGIVGGA